MPRQQIKVELEEEIEDIELSLGLSLNGRFGIDPNRQGGASKLTRSSSIPDFLIPITTPPRVIDDRSAINMKCGVNNNGKLILRTRSLPVETAEEWRKRKELQGLRRLEAKRKRSEKKAAAFRDRSRGLGEEVNGFDLDNNINNESLSFQCVNNNGGGGGGGSGSPGSIGSQGSGSSVVLDFEFQPFQGKNKGTEERCPTTLRQSDQKPPIRQGSIIRQGSLIRQGSTVIDRTRSNSKLLMENSSNKPTVTTKQAKEMGSKSLEDMPSVSTKGLGPNGKKIEGFLYRYKKGEEVRIVCVCHGSFLSPAEFVKHAGGGDVEQPLKHIVVTPSSHM
ncbi:hypothetical protein ACFE04_009669 [Oxalis oulophora]